MNTEIINGTVTVQQPSDVEFVKYKFRVENYLNNDPNSELICTQIDSCIIYNRTIELSLGNDTNICKGSAVTYNDTPDKSGDNYSYSYIWRYISDNQSTEIGNESSVTYQPDASGRLVLNISDNMGCSAENGLTVNIHNAPDITIEGKRDICYGSSTTLKAVASIENCSFSWNDDNISQTDEITVSPEANQIYTVTATNPNAGCTATKDATVTVTKYPVISCSESQRICEGEAAVIEVTGAAQRFMWSSSDISIDGATGTRYEVYPQTTTKYVIHAYNNDTLNCETKDSLTIYVSKNPVIALRYTPNMIDEISPQIQFTDSTEDVTQRLWVISDGSEYTEKSFIHTFVLDDTSSSFSVQLTGRTDAGCTDSAKVNIGIRHDHHLWAPTGLYLHGMNNTTRMFRLYINDLNTYSIKIFDRWGTVVFESNDPEQAWDCTYNGNDVLQGVYSWIAVYSHNDNPKREIRKTGSIMIYN